MGDTSRAPAQSNHVSGCYQPSPAIPFTILDLAESWHIAVSLAAQGVEWKIDLADPLRPETFPVKRFGKALFRVWRSVAGFHLQFLFLEESCSPELVRSLAQLWATMIHLMQTPPSILARLADRVTERNTLPNWLTDELYQQKRIGASQNRG